MSGPTPISMQNEEAQNVTLSRPARGSRRVSWFLREKLHPSVPARGSMDAASLSELNSYFTSVNFNKPQRGRPSMPNQSRRDW